MMSAAVLCFPPAGAGASFFHPWIGRRDGLTVIPVELPGREKRFAEPECEDLDTLVATILPELRAAVAGFGHVAVFGHSFGALLAYEAARALAGDPGLPGMTLVVSGATWPGRPRPGRVTGLPDEEFIARVEAIAGYKHPALDEPELRELVLPPLRADAAMHESYRFTPREPLDVPVVAVRGTADTLVSAEDTAEWAGVTRGGLTLAEIGGGHMYLVDAWPDVLDLIARSVGAGTPS
ncbi:thioesterase [Streptomyces sp. WAC05374]|uniref:thioesterase II family protein n=1 Tax=Streptomyces sp. WAC05374 TaxID=2487420 RepID=UPI000F86B8F1|nr:alpha/beta fold hydrolase [Streptomyces sp. WAC05374]RST18343.1 thioesterase [Streptomyces sp. WAC05374]TDF39114.1 thioesterase [Streptomyces sp. WAC05374]TDF47463.1 thioesterase [Streptomyces sp. WAC05374]TDF48222.1 thioesterase [Streptomyces sp. WAC05374]